MGVVLIFSALFHFFTLRIFNIFYGGFRNKQYRKEVTGKRFSGYDLIETELIRKIICALRGRHMR